MDIVAKTPSQRAPPPGHHYYECQGLVCGSDTTMTDDDLLRDVRDLTPFLNLNASQDDVGSLIITSTSSELAETLSRFQSPIVICRRYNDCTVDHNRRAGNIPRTGTAADG